MTDKTQAIEDQESASTRIYYVEGNNVDHLRGDSWLICMWIIAKRYKDNEDYLVLFLATNRM
jgi:hypothetical protein